MSQYAHHTKDEVCPGCEDRVKEGHPEIQLMWKFVKDKYPRSHLSHVFRDQIDQEMAYQNGKTKLHFPNSKHNLKPAQAMDIFEIDDNGVAVFDPKFCYQVNADLISAGFVFKWGGSWRALGDYDHFEI